MADINDPVIAAFVREVARPAAEEVSQAEANADFVIDRWAAVIAPMLAGVADSDVILEARGDGVQALTKGDLVAIMDGVNRVRTANTTAQRRQVLKGRVRILRAQ